MHNICVFVSCTTSTRSNTFNSQIKKYFKNLESSKLSSFRLKIVVMRKIEHELLSILVAKTKQKSISVTFVNCTQIQKH